MAPRPSAERPPKGLSAEWCHVWDHALKVLKEQGTWAWELSPLLAEYVLALRAAEASRSGFAWLAHLEEAVASEDVDWLVLRQIAGGLPTAWDRHVKRAAALADQLALTPRGRKAIGVVSDDDSEGIAPAGSLAALDELAPRRRAS